MSSSANEHLVTHPATPKPKLSPLEFRNTDLVSRLLAATPPYLYNMSLLPNTFFFSEMLRSFVQAKSTSSTTHTATNSDNNSNNNSNNNKNFINRRSRKRPYATSRSETATTSFPHSSLNNNNNDNNKINREDPLELTTDKLLHQDGQLVQEIPHHHNHQQHHHHHQEHSAATSSATTTASSGLILPPPPPIWYPPLYPTAPYGIDPLHFFIDLRVSGHIYDRKSQNNQPPASTIDGGDTDSIHKSSPESNFKQSRHTSAFSVPYKTSSVESSGEVCKNSSKFDVKSMGFDNQLNRIGTSYITSNLIKIYRNVDESKKLLIDDGGELTEDEKEKKVRDLRALIGLELVVDYMNHAKPQARRITDLIGIDHRVQEAEEITKREHHSDDDTNHSCNSPTLEVVAIQ